MGIDSVACGVGIALCRERCVQIMPGLNKAGINVGCSKACLKEYPAAPRSQILTRRKGKSSKSTAVGGLQLSCRHRASSEAT